MPVKDGIKFAKNSLIQISRMVEDAEVIVVDDGSIDGTYEYCRSFAAFNPNFIVERSLGIGISEALNYGISIARNDWIARFDIDDDYELTRISEQIQVLNSTNAILVFSDYTIYADGKKSLGLIPGGVLNLPTKLSLITGRRTPHPSAIFSKEVFFKAGGYFSQDAPAEDLSLWLRMCDLGNFATTDTSLLNYRLSATSTTVKNRTNSMVRRTEVLTRYPIRKEYFENLVSDLDNVVSQYSVLSSPGKRTLLMLLDIIKFSSFYGVKISPTQYLCLFRNFLRLNTLVAGLQLFFQAKRRSRFRKNSSRLL